MEDWHDMSEAVADAAAYAPDAEVVAICRDLIRIDTTNFGPQPGPGERQAAEHGGEEACFAASIQADAKHALPGQGGYVGCFIKLQKGRPSPIEKRSANVRGLDAACSSLK